MAAALTHPRANVSGMETPTIRLLWGPGGAVELTDFGHDGEPARIYDLINLAAFLVARGLGYQRKVCRPSEVNGAIAVTLGDDGRAQWVDGGGDISADDVGWAIAAALETGGVQLFDEAVSDHLARDAARCAAALVATMGRPRSNDEGGNDVRRPRQAGARWALDSRRLVGEICRTRG